MDLATTLSENPVEQSGAGQRRHKPSHRHALIPPSVFHRESRFPTDDEVRYVLSDSHAAWLALLCLVRESLGDLSEIWKYTGGNIGWALRLVHKDRVVLYLTPQPRQFIVSVALGERAVAAASVAQLSASVLAAIDAAPRYPEGRGIRITVQDGRDIATLARLAKIKCELSR